MRTNRKRIGRLLTRYHSELKDKTFAEIKADPNLAHVVFDHYHQAMRILNDDRVTEDRAMAEIHAKSRAGRPTPSAPVTKPL